MMSTQYAFAFDSRYCSGCKACQVACKDKNDLPVGVLWRRVMEVNSGDWSWQGQAWTQSVFAYYLSIACNHYIHPKCAGVCPANAYSVRPDGIVILDPAKYMGCHYCNWACPYGAPQYNQEAGKMTKCDLCADAIDTGLPPACVAACPLRVLELAGSAEQPGKITPQVVYPLPAYSRTEPRFYITPHPAVEKMGAQARIANREEYLPRERESARKEISLVTFTLLVQAAAGTAIYTALLGLTGLTFPLFLSIGVLLGLAGFASLFHLGTPGNAWRSLNHLKKSWLSREILFFGLFGASCALAAGLHWLEISSRFVWLAAVVSAGLVYCMRRVYRLPSVPAWNGRRADLEFLLSTITLGAVGFLVAGVPGPLPVWIKIAVIAALTGELALVLTSQLSRIDRLSRASFILVGIVLAGADTFIPSLSDPHLSAMVALSVLYSEAIGRWQFYTRRQPNL
ncbi:MAG: DmsC/YnfH family molybdoenzyme membrane anchor subunit [Chloroflexota bacterium]